MYPIEPQSITALILCGGQALRMGGQDKGLILLKDKPLVEWTIQHCQEQVGAIMINANRHLDLYQALKLPTYPDLSNDFKGPLAGFQVGLTYAQSPYVLILPCDTPCFPKDLVEKLANAMVQQQVDCAYPFTLEDGQEQPHPVFCLLKKSLLDSLNEFLAGGQRKIDRWLTAQKHVKVQFDEPSNFLNINTPEELKQIEQLL